MYCLPFFIQCFFLQGKKHPCHDCIGFLTLSQYHQLTAKRQRCSFPFTIMDLILEFGFTLWSLTNRPRVPSSVVLSSLQGRVLQKCCKYCKITSHQHYESLKYDCSMIITIIKIHVYCLPFFLQCFFLQG